MKIHSHPVTFETCSFTENSRNQTDIHDGMFINKPVLKEIINGTDYFSADFISKKMP